MKNKTIHKQPGLMATFLATVGALLPMSNAPAQAVPVAPVQAKDLEIQRQLEREEADKNTAPVLTKEQKFALDQAFAAKQVREMKEMPTNVVPFPTPNKRDRDEELNEGIETLTEILFPGSGRLDQARGQNAQMDSKKAHGPWSEMILAQRSMGLHKNDFPPMPTR